MNITNKPLKANHARPFGFLSNRAVCYNRQKRINEEFSDLTNSPSSHFFQKTGIEESGNWSPNHIPDGTLKPVSMHSDKTVSGKAREKNNSENGK